MRKSIIVAGAALLCAGTAYAGEMSTGQTDMDGYSAMRWAGPFAGTAAGFSWGKAKDRGLEEPDQVLLQGFSLNQTKTVNGASYGGYVGYNWVAGNIVYGIEANFNGSSMSGTLSQVQTVLDAQGEYVYQTEHEVTWYGTGVGRLGFASGPLMLYVNGGVVFGNEKTSFTATYDDTVYGSPIRSSSVHVGWTAGGGFEYALNDVLSTRVEFNHVDYAEKSIANGRDNVDVHFETVKFGVTVKMR